MAAILTTTITPKELERQAVEAFQGKTWRVFLALRQDVGLGITSSITEWEAEKVATANGYADATGTVGTGTYNNTTSAYELPALTAVFTATGAGYSYDSLIVQIDGNTHPHSVGLFSEPIVMVAGQTRVYSVVLVQDD